METNEVEEAPSVIEPSKLEEKTPELMAAVSKTPTLNALQAYLDDLNSINIPSDTESNDALNFEIKVKEIETHFIELQDKCLQENKAVYWYLYGKLYNMTPGFRPKAVELLSKAVKLDPTLIDAWNELGDSYWYKQETDLAVRCYETALEKKENKVSLRNLSVAARKKNPDSYQEMEEMFQKSVEFAKRAVNLEPDDGESWITLGNTYLSKFFGYIQDLKIANQALAAYQQAEQTPSTLKHPELHHNKATLLAFIEKYERALICYSKALDINPLMKNASESHTLLLSYLNNIQKNVNNRGKIRPKKLEAYKKQAAGATAKVQSLVGNLQETTINSLAMGANDTSFIVGVVIWSVQNGKILPFTFGLLDKEGSIASVSLFNLNLGKGVVIGDVIAIPQPCFDKVDFKYDSSVFNFSKVRVSQPLSLIINYKLAPSDFFCKTDCVVNHL